MTKPPCPASQPDIPNRTQFASRHNDIQHLAENLYRGLILEMGDYSPDSAPAHYNRKQLNRAYQRIEEGLSMLKTILISRGLM